MLMEKRSHMIRVCKIQLFGKTTSGYRINVYEDSESVLIFRNAESLRHELEEDGSQSDNGRVGAHFEEPGNLVFSIFSFHQTFCCS